MAYPIQKKSSYRICEPEKYGEYHQRPQIKIVKKQRKTKRNLFAIFINASCKAFILALFCYFAVPFNFENITRPVFLNRYLNRNIKADMANYVSPTLSYLNNANFMGHNVIVEKRKDELMIDIVPSGRLITLEGKLRKLMKKYPNLKPSIYIYDYVSAKTVEINANSPVPVASIIKIPILFELMRQSDNVNKIDLKEKVIFEDTYRTMGSGDLQYISSNQKYTLDELAYLMITKSDNSATNLLLDKIGGKEGVNRALRNWGTDGKMNAWLPDIEGTNKISAKDISKILYNLDAPKFLSAKSKDYINHYMSNLPTENLLKKGLGNDAKLLHKTGDIGKMLGDSGIVYLPDDKKYIITVLVQRNHNDYGARDFIEQVSAIAYNEFSKSYTSW